MKKNKIYISLGLSALTVLILSGCDSSGGVSDLKTWEKDETAKFPMRVEPLPKVRPYNAPQVDIQNIVDPFKQRLIVATGATGGVSPDKTRRKEPLEAFNLDTMTMVGSMAKAGKIFALIKTRENVVYQVGVGNYIGQNYGKILAIEETSFRIREQIQDGDVWVEKERNVNLQEADGGGSSRSGK